MTSPRQSPRGPGRAGDASEGSRSFISRVRAMGSAPNSALWVIFLLVAGGTAAVSWDWGEVAWPGVVASVALLALIGGWSRARGWPLFPW